MLQTIPNSIHFNCQDLEKLGKLAKRELHSKFEHKETVREERARQVIAAPMPGLGRFGCLQTPCKADAWMRIIPPLPPFPTYTRTHTLFLLFFFPEL